MTLLAVLAPAIVYVAAWEFLRGLYRAARDAALAARDTVREFCRLWARNVNP
jgi:hypothetical protein